MTPTAKRLERLVRLAKELGDIEATVRRVQAEVRDEVRRTRDEVLHEEAHHTPSHVPAPLG